MLKRKKGLISAYMSWTIVEGSQEGTQEETMEAQWLPVHSGS